MSRHRKYDKHAFKADRLAFFGFRPTASTGRHVADPAATMGLEDMDDLTWAYGPNVRAAVDALRAEMDQPVSWNEELSFLDRMDGVGRR